MVGLMFKKTFSKIIYANDSFKNTFGYQNPIKSPLSIILPDLIAKEHDSFLRNYMLTNNENIMNKMT
jgi:hypothetical protein